MEERYQPVFGDHGASGAWTNAKVLVLICMLNEAFVAHYNAPRFYTELKNNTIKRYATMVGLSFGASSLIYLLVMVFGFLTFGSSCDGYILNNYSNNDPLATLCRLCVAGALICTYPVVSLLTRFSPILFLRKDVHEMFLMVPLSSLLLSSIVPNPTRCSWESETVSLIFASYPCTNIHQQT